LARGRLHRRRPASARERDREASRAADRHRESLGRLRHARPGPDGGDREARRLHHHADPDHRLSFSLHGEDHVRSSRRLYLHHRRERLHLRGRGARRRTVEDVPGSPRRRQGQSRQDQLWNTRRRHQPAHHHGADRQAAGHQVDPRPVQGQFRGDGRSSSIPAASGYW
jgi:hypothetical protein